MEPKWLEIARKEIGVSETRNGENARIIEYASTTTLKAKEDEVPWCSAFVNWCMSKAGIKGTGLANARSWLDWGETLAAPKLGCIVVFKRGDNPTSGHVAFYLESAGNLLKVLGGNQSDRVKISNYPKDAVIGYRWPKGEVYKI